MDEYAADTKLPQIRAVMEKLRICFINFTLWEKGDMDARRILREDQKLLGNDSCLGIIDAVCRSYGILEVSKNWLNKRLVKQQIKTKCKMDFKFKIFSNKKCWKQHDEEDHKLLCDE